MDSIHLHDYQKPASRFGRQYITPRGARLSPSGRAELGTFRSDLRQRQSTGTLDAVSDVEREVQDLWERRHSGGLDSMNWPKST